MSTLLIYGDVRNVLEGRITSSNTKSINVENIGYGLGAGNCLAPNLFGETLVWDQIAWVTIVDDDLPKTRGVEQILFSPFLLAVSKKTAYFPYLVTRSQSLNDFYNEISDQFENGAAIAGKGLFDSFDGAYLKKSPIYSENINDNPTIYWEHPPPLASLKANFFGVFITEKGQKTFSQETLKLAFYQNPNEKNVQRLLTHTHAALLDEKNQILGVRHLLTSSTLKEADLKIFPIDQLLWV